MRIVILPSARDDLASGFEFYEEQAEGIGSYFLESLFSDLESLFSDKLIPSGCMLASSQGSLGFIGFSPSAFLTRSIMPSRRR